MAARYLSRKEENEVKKAISAYNKRITDLSKQKRFQGVILPSKINAAEALAGVTNGRELNRLKNRMERAVKPENLSVVKNRKGVRATKGFVAQYKLDLDAANRQRKKRYDTLKDKKVYQGYKPAGTAEELKSDMLQNHRPLNNTWSQVPNEKQARKMANRARREAQGDRYNPRDLQYKQNYLGKASQALSQAGYQQVYDAISGLTPAQFYELMFTHPDIDIEYLYDDAQEQEKVMEIRIHVERFKLDNNL